MEWGVPEACLTSNVSEVLFARVTIEVYLGCRCSVIISYFRKIEANRKSFMRVGGGFLDDHFLSSHPYLTVDLFVRKEDD